MDAERDEDGVRLRPRSGGHRPGRRAFLLGGGLALLSIGGAAAARPEGVRRAYAQIVCGGMPDPPRTHPGTLQTARVDGRRVVVALPPDAREGLPVVVMLHGAAGDARTPFDAYAVDRYLAAGGERLAMVAVDDWPSADITGAVLPYLEASGMDTGRIGLLGWAAGGAGALRLAAKLGPEKVGAVVATSPAVTAARAPLREIVDIPIWLGCGEHDAWAAQTETMLKGLRALGATTDGGITKGCEDMAYRRRVLPEQLAFLARHV
ncbi:hypothetical protein GCM10010517_07000 [Streptosporangium fragile]|uniref:Dienelactone hydrolase domain-containing protein n=1 Tax=Streptosporangium fragile TaxID=46186 RepID=A0ABP6I950_9ACTN